MSDDEKHGHRTIRWFGSRRIHAVGPNGAELVVPLAMAVCSLLGYAAWRDITTRTIPDAVSIGILLIGLAARIPDGWTGVGVSAAVAVLIFILLLPLNVFGWLGGGDLKLLVALASGLSPLASYRLFSAVVLAGGVLALIYLVLGKIFARRRSRQNRAQRRRSTVGRIVAVEVWRIRRGAPLPYGLAIAAGGSLVIGFQGT